MPPARGRARAETRKLTQMIKDLQIMKAELCPDEKELKTQEEMQHFDTFQRKKYELNLVLTDLRADIERLHELGSKLRNGEKTTTIIRIQSENYSKLKTAMELFNDLKLQFENDAKKKSKLTGKQFLDEKEKFDRSHLIMLLGEELRDLTTQNSTIFSTLSGGGKDGNFNLEQQRQTREMEDRVQLRKMRDMEQRERREKTRANRKLKHHESGIDDSDFQHANAHKSEQELAFEEKVNTNMIEEDKMLLEIMNGLDELKEIANEANKSLTIQKAMLEQVDEKMESNLRTFKSANQRMKNILEESGGMSRWCPILILLIVILGLIGYLLHIV